MSNATRIAELNDAFRQKIGEPGRGKYYVTDGVSSLGPEFVMKAIAAVRAFNDFTADNDPHHEHDFGSLTLDGEKVFWKIDYYDRRDPDLGSDDPSDPNVTERVMTIMLAEEY
ncbi:MAG: DUF3768 domain-containing protein [Vicinamibacterales bacterium]